MEWKLHTNIQGNPQADYTGSRSLWCGLCSTTAGLNQLTFPERARCSPTVRIKLSSRSLSLLGVVRWLKICILTLPKNLVAQICTNSHAILYHTVRQTQLCHCEVVWHMFRRYESLPSLKSENIYEKYKNADERKTKGSCTDRMIDYSSEKF